MKKLITLLFIFISCNTIAQGPISYIEAYRETYFDDTATLQAQLNAGPLTLPFGHAPYMISAALTVTYSFNMNVNTIHTTQITDGALKLSTPGASVSNGTVQGPWSYSTDAGNPGGGIGIRLLAANTTVSNVHVGEFAGYGILIGGFNNTTVTGCTIDKTGYIAVYFDPEVTGIHGGTFTNNIVDRSMISPTTIQQGAIAIRASTGNFAFTTYGWTITGNHIKMPPNPASAANECMEVRTMINSTVSNNIMDYGTIGISVVHCVHMDVSNNVSTGSRDCGIEFADTWNSHLTNNSTKNSLKDGILFDGGNIRDKYDTLYYDTVRTSALSAFHLFTGARRLVVIGCDFTTSTKGIYMQGADTLLLVNTKIDGQGTSGTSGIFLDGTPGNVTINFGSIIRCTYAVFAYNTTVGAVVNNNVGTNTLLTSTPTQFAGNFTNGAHYGVNNHFNFSPLVFNPLPVKIYGATDFDPGATSSLTIIYTSANTAIASIVANYIHITGTGTVNITANDGSGPLVQPLTVNKASLLIVADNKRRPRSTANPVFTTTYLGFVYGETNSVLTILPTLSTTAGTGSPTGNYIISNNGAAAANYNITNINGVLQVYSNSPIHRKAIVLKH